MSGLNREGVLKLVNTVLDVADTLKDVVDNVGHAEETEETPEPSTGSKNKYEDYPVGTVVSSVIMKGTDNEETFLHVKQSDGSWDEFTVETDHITGRPVVEPAGAVGPSTLKWFEDSGQNWTLTVLTEGVG